MLMLNYDWIFIVSNYNDHSDHPKDPIFIIIVLFSLSLFFFFLCLVNLLLYYIKGTEEKSTFRNKKWRWVYWFSSFQLLLLQSFWAGPRLLSRQMVKFGSFFVVFSFERKSPFFGLIFLFLCTVRYGIVGIQKYFEWQQELSQQLERFWWYSL